MNITMNTKKALLLLMENREKHVNEYSEQVQGWKKAMENYSKELADWGNSVSEDIFDTNIRQSKKPIEPSKPASYVGDYDRLIQQLEYHVLENIELNECEFSQIVNDEFRWKQTFLMNSATYIG